MSQPTEPPSPAPEHPSANFLRLYDAVRPNDHFLQTPGFGEDPFALDAPDAPVDIAGGLAALQRALQPATTPASQPDPLVRRAAVQTLGHLGGTDAMQFLLSALSRDQEHDAGVSQAAGVARRRVTGEGGTALGAVDLSDLPAARLVEILRPVLPPASLEELKIILPGEAPYDLGSIKGSDPMSAAAELETFPLPGLAPDQDAGYDDAEDRPRPFVISRLFLQTLEKIAESTRHLRFSLDKAAASFKSTTSAGQAFSFGSAYCNLTENGGLRAEIFCQDFPEADHVHVRLVDEKKPEQWQSPAVALERYGDDRLAIIFLESSVLTELDKLKVTTLVLSFEPSSV